MLSSKQFQKIGIPRGEPVRIAREAGEFALGQGMTRDAVEALLHQVAENPRKYIGDPTMGRLARTLLTEHEAAERYKHRDSSAPYRQWGDNLDPESVKQMHNACRLPVSVRGALMPDAHLGYGLPIGGVLATDNAVIPYAVGVDIACRVKMTVLDVPVAALDTDVERLRKAIEAETRFGVGANFKDKRHHDVMDRDWSVSPITKRNRDKAWAQLGTSGSGNHFVEFGEFTVDDDGLGLAPGTYLALLSHSGSRGTGAAVCDHYSRIARALRPGMPDELRFLAWLTLDSGEGQEYWAAMELMGEYAKANHACIHRHVARNLGAEVLLDIENHHNFAWKEEHEGKDVIVHRKGATPAGPEALGIIPGSMATPAYVVRGKGGADSLNSASHGAGRVMSRTAAKKTFSWDEANARLAAARVELMSAGLDEVPMVYKDIDEVMALQQDLVEAVGTFHPRLVKMAPAGERPED